MLSWQSRDDTGVIVRNYTWTLKSPTGRYKVIRTTRVRLFPATVTQQVVQGQKSSPSAGCLLPHSPAPVLFMPASLSLCLCARRFYWADPTFTSPSLFVLAKILALGIHCISLLIWYIKMQLLFYANCRYYHLYSTLHVCVISRYWWLTPWWNQENAHGSVCVEGVGWYTITSVRVSTHMGIEPATVRDTNLRRICSLGYLFTSLIRWGSLTSDFFASRNRFVLTSNSFISLWYITIKQRMDGPTVDATEL